MHDIIHLPIVSPFHHNFNVKYRANVLVVGKSDSNETLFPRTRLKKYFPSCLTQRNWLMTLITLFLNFSFITLLVYNFYPIAGIFISMQYVANLSSIHISVWWHLHVTDFFAIQSCVWKQKRSCIQTIFSIFKDIIE